MTAINISTDIPSNIDTLEKLAAWVGLALERCNPTLKILESPEASPQRVAQAVLIQADDATHRMIIRLALPIKDDYASNSTIKFWQNASELSAVGLPTAYKAN